MPALEPGDRMRAQLERAVPEAEVIAAGAESIPLQDNWVDAVTAGQSFHWFRFDEAIREVRRVLRAGRGLGLVWNERDQEDELQSEVTKLIRPFVPPCHPRVIESGWRESLESSELFGPLEERRVALRRRARCRRPGRTDRDDQLRRCRERGKRVRLERGLRELAAPRGGRVPFNYLTNAYVTYSLPYA